MRSRFGRPGAGRGREPSLCSCFTSLVRVALALILVVSTVALVTVAPRPSWAAPASERLASSNLVSLEYAIEGGDAVRPVDPEPSYQKVYHGRISGGTVRVRGRVRLAIPRNRPADAAVEVTVQARGPSNRFEWSEKALQGGQGGLVIEKAFDVSTEVPRGSPCYVFIHAALSNGTSAGCHVKAYFEPDVGSGSLASPSAPVPQGSAPSNRVPLWMVVLGATAVLGLAAVGMGAVMAARKRAPAPDAEAGAALRAGAYILQASPESLCIAPGTSCEFTVQARRSTRGVGAAPGEPAPDVSIRLSLPEETCDLTLDPLTCTGSATCRLTAGLHPTPRVVAIGLIGTGPDGSTSASILVSVEDPLELEITSRPEPPFTVGEGSGFWLYARARASTPAGEARAREATRRIRYSFSGPNSDWLRKMGAESFHDDAVCIHVCVVPPRPDAALSSGTPCGVAVLEPERLERSLPLPLGDGIELVATVDGGEEGDVLYSEAEGAWIFPEVHASFYRDGGRAGPRRLVTPEFRYGFAQQPFRAVPDILETVEFKQGPAHHYALKVRLRPDVDLDRDHPGLLADGTVQLVLCALGDGGRAWEGAVAFRLRPALRMVAYGHAQGSRCRGGRQPFEELDLAADGCSRLPLLAFLRRTDLPPLGEEARPQAQEVAEIRASLHGDLVGHGHDDFELEVDREGTADGFYAFQVRSRRPLLHEESRVGGTLVASFECSPRLDLPRNYRREAWKFELPLQPRNLFVKLWVVPGEERGTSRACALVCLPTQPPHPLEGIRVQLRVISSGVGTLSVDGDQDTCRTSPDGTASWLLRYHGLQWEEVRGAVFQVQCGLPDADGHVAYGTMVRVDVGANILDLLSAIQDERDGEALRLDNPHASLLGATGALSASDFHCGPALYLVHEILREPDMAGPDGVEWSRRLEAFTCGQYSQRIFEFLRRRRFPARPAAPSGPAEMVLDPDVAACMNGIEANRYLILLPGPVRHAFAGIHLSGNAPLLAESSLAVDATESKGPRFVDPWWRQRWEDALCRIPEGLLTTRGEMARVAASNVQRAAVVALAGAFLRGAGAASGLPALFELSSDAEESDVTDLRRGVCLDSLWRPFDEERYLPGEVRLEDWRPGALQRYYADGVPYVSPVIPW